MQTFHWSSVDHAKTADAQRHSGTLEEWLSYVDQTYGTTKDGPAFCGAVFEGDKRGRKNVEGVDFLMLDIDDARAPVKETIAPLMRYAFFAYSSYSHGVRPKWEEGQPRFRVLLPLARTVDATEYDLVWQHVHDLMSGAPDSGAKDPSRLCYLPREKAPDAERQPWRKFNEGDALLDPDDIKGWSVESARVKHEEEKQRQRERARQLRNELKEAGDADTRIENALHHIPPHDRDVWIEVGMALHAAESSGIISGAESLWDTWSMGSEKYDATDLAHQWRSFDYDPSGIGIGTLFHYAMQHGWTPPREEPFDYDEALRIWEKATGRDAVGSGTPRIEPLTAKNDRYISYRALEDLGFAQGLVCWDGNRWQQYDSERGIFVESKELVYKIVDREYHLLEIVSDDPEQDTQFYIAQHNNCTRAESKARINAEREDWFEHQRNGLVFANGFFDVGMGKLIDNSPRHRKRACYGFDYQPDAKCPTWDWFLHTTFEGVPDEDEKIRLIEEYAGICLLGHGTKFHTTLFFQGEGRNGKSTLTETLIRAFPDGATSSISPHHIGSGNSHAMNSIAGLEGKLLNVVDDLDKRDMLNMGDFKAIVSGHQVQARRMRQEPFWFHPRAGHIFNVNGLPVVTDSSDGFWRRVQVIDFDIQVDEDDVDETLPARLESETPGIVSRLIQSGMRALDRGHLEIPGSVKLATSEWRRGSNPMQIWLEENIEELLDETLQEIRANGQRYDLRKFADPDWLSSAALYEHYKQWTSANKFGVKSSRTWGEDMQRMGVPRKKSNGSHYNVRQWAEGRRLVEVSDDFSTKVPF